MDEKLVKAIAKQITDNTFCATGPGGGVDPSCGKESGAFSEKNVVDKVRQRTIKEGEAKVAKGKEDAKTAHRQEYMARYKKMQVTRDRIASDIADIPSGSTSYVAEHHVTKGKYDSSDGFKTEHSKTGEVKHHKTADEAARHIMEVGGRYGK